jgi:hypothetical protein
MEKNRIFMLVIVAVIVGGFVLAVFVPLTEPDGSGWNYELPGDGSQDEEALALYYSEIGMVPSGAGNSSAISETFGASETYDFFGNVRAAHEVKIWVDSRDTGEHVTGSEILEDLTVGINTINMIQFNPGKYVARVIVEDVLVRNLVFEITA